MTIDAYISAEKHSARNTTKRGKGMLLKYTQIFQKFLNGYMNKVEESG